MQVSHASDHVTHAVIGGLEPINLTISDSPEFFQILSSTLYTDQALAVVRENLCNAWDAQIEAGKTHIPLEIILNDEFFSVRDRGSGIPHDRMGEIYGTYGGSTKREDGRVTGGFGLGCKSSFALVDHFEVTSWNQGTKTTYNLSKSSAEVGGRPAIIPIVSVPTQESGLQVKVELPSAADRFRFNNLIRQIIANGEMNATLNGEPIKTLPFSEATDKFVITSTQLISDKGNTWIYVRYGHVIYPVERHIAYSQDYDKAISYLHQMRGKHTFSLVLLASPHSITVTPSRESLSMQDKTIETLTKLLKNFRHKLQQAYRKEVLAEAERGISFAWQSMNMAGVFTNTNHIMLFANVGQKRKLFCTTLKQALDQIAYYNFPDDKTYLLPMLMMRARSLVEGGFGQLAPSFKAELSRSLRRNQADRASPWVVKAVIAPLTQKIKEAGLDPNKLYALCQFHNWMVKTERYHNLGHVRKLSNGLSLVPAENIAARSLEKSFGFARNIIILAHRKADLVERVEQFPIIKYWLGHPDGSMVYMVPNSAKKAAEAREFFTKLGVHLIDLTIWHKWEQKPVRSVPAAPSTPKSSGLVQLSSVCFPNGLLNPQAVRNPEGLTRLDKPQFVVKVSTAEDAKKRDKFYGPAATAIARRWGDVTCITTSESQYQAQLKKGIKSLDEHVTKTVCNAVLKSRKIQRALTLDPDLVSYGHANQALIKLICGDQLLATHFKVWPNLTDEERDYLAIWVHNLSDYPWNRVPEIEAVKNVLGTVEPSPAFAKLIRALDNKLGGSIDTYRAAHLLKLTNPDPEQIKQQTTLRKIIKMIATV